MGCAQSLTSLMFIEIDVFQHQWLLKLQYWFQNVCQQSTIFDFLTFCFVSTVAETLTALQKPEHKLMTLNTKTLLLSCCDQYKFYTACSSLSSQALWWIILGFLHISQEADSCRAESSCVGRQVTCAEWSLSSVIYLKRAGHASNVWFTLGLTGLAWIGWARCGEIHLWWDNRWRPAAISCICARGETSTIKAELKHRAEPQSWTQRGTQCRVSVSICDVMTTIIKNNNNSPGHSCSR